VILKLARILAIAGFLSLACSADPISKVKFNTTPPGAAIHDQLGNSLGRTGEFIDLDWNGVTQLDLQIDLDGYQRNKIIVSQMQLQKTLDKDGRAVWPPKPVELTANRPPWLYAAPLSLAPLAALAFWKFRRRAKSVTESTDDKRPNFEVFPDSGSLAGKMLGRYRLLQRIGAGGMATVYRALPPDAKDSSEVVAIKVMRRELAEDPEMAGRFKREAKVTGSLDHPNIVRVNDWGDQDGLAYLAMEWMDGGTLRDAMQGQPAALEDAWDALSPLCEAVHYAHCQGVVHRDLKPENIMTTQSGLLKVTDFGLARSGQADQITATGAVLGTPAYMAPEQIQGLAPGHAMDQYAIGVIAFELLTGQLPFGDCEPVQLIFKTMSEKPFPPSHFRQLPAEVDQVILKMLAKNPRERYQSLEAAAQALQGVLHG
jgi:tRNA A-37 threonylcarbamoyl transferase component Bud32